MPVCSDCYISGGGECHGGCHRGHNRKATPSENLLILRARLSLHLSPAESWELEKAASVLVDPLLDYSASQLAEELLERFQKTNGIDFCRLETLKKIKEYCHSELRRWKKVKP